MNTLQVRKMTYAALCLAIAMVPQIRKLARQLSLNK